MAPALCSILFSALLTDCLQECDAGFPIMYRFDGKLFNLKRLQAKFKVQTNVLDKLLYADDLAENVKSETARGCVCIYVNMFAQRAAR